MTNTPASAGDRALDWMALGQMLTVEGAGPTLTAAAGNGSSSTPKLFVHAMSGSTRFERGQIERLGLAQVRY
jgi:arginase